MVISPLVSDKLFLSWQSLDIITMNQQLADCQVFISCQGDIKISWSHLFYLHWFELFYKALQTPFNGGEQWYQITTSAIPFDTLVTEMGCGVTLACCPLGRMRELSPRSRMSILLQRGNAVILGRNRIPNRPGAYTDGILWSNTNQLSVSQRWSWCEKNETHIYTHIKTRTMHPNNIDMGEFISCVARRTCRQCGSVYCNTPTKWFLASLFSSCW